MGRIIKKEVCQCAQCGNEAEMNISCSLPDSHEEGAVEPQKVKGTATCSTCGNEAEIWLNL